MQTLRGIRTKLKTNTQDLHTRNLLLPVVLGMFLLQAWIVLPGVWAKQAARAGEGGEFPQLQTQVDPTLLKQALEGDDGPLRFIVELTSQANLSQQPEDTTATERRSWLVDSLQTTAQVSQAGIRAELEAGRSQGKVVDYHSFWIFNGLRVVADADTLLSLATRPDVKAIYSDRWRRWIEPPLQMQDEPQAMESDPEWHIARIRADLVWSALDLDGSGVTVAVLDSGVDWQHPLLQSQYRGYKEGGLVLHQGNWYCATDEGYLYPVDAHGHGTHVTGLVLGGQDSSGRDIGVAPGARWIAVKMLDDRGYAYDSWIHEGFEWVMAPAGNPALAPEIVNGSWGSNYGAAETFRLDLQALRAADIVPVFAAGNEGPDSSSLRSPASYAEALAVGATDDLDQVTEFSSRGPSAWGEIKPEVVAPGAQIRSSLPGGTYGVKSGTSMATPLVSGLAALMLQADPSLTTSDIEAILTSTTVPLGDTVPNNITGWGRIDAYSAAAVALQAGFVAGQVTRQPDQQPLPTAQITAYDHLGEQRALVQADESGHYRLALPSGQYNLDVEAFGYAPQTVPDVIVLTAFTTTVNSTLGDLPTGVLWGTRQ